MWQLDQVVVIRRETSDGTDQYGLGNTVSRLFLSNAINDLRGSPTSLPLRYRSQRLFPTRRAIAPFLPTNVIVGTTDNHMPTLTYLLIYTQIARVLVLTSSGEPSSVTDYLMQEPQWKRQSSVLAMVSTA